MSWGGGGGGSGGRAALEGSAGPPLFGITVSSGPTASVRPPLPCNRFEAAGTEARALCPSVAVSTVIESVCELSSDVLRWSHMLQ